MDCIDRPVEDAPECWGDPLELYGEAMLDSRLIDQDGEAGLNTRDPDYQFDPRWNRLHPW